MDFQIVGALEAVETIAEGSGIRDLAMLRKRFGLGKWRKKKGIASDAKRGWHYGEGRSALVRGARHWPGQGQDEGMVMKFVVCVSRDGFGDFSADDLTLGRLYEVVTPPDKPGMVRIIDDSGEDYLYPASMFDTVEVPEPTAARLHALLA